MGDSSYTESYINSPQPCYSCPASKRNPSFLRKRDLMGFAALYPSYDSTILSRKPGHQLDMRGVAELVDRRDAFDPVAAVDQYPCIAREGRDVAGDGDHGRYLACRQLRGLRLRTLARRIEHDC